MNLKTSLTDAGRVYKMYASRLEKLGITTFEDFLYFIPTRYENYSLISKIADIQPGEVVTLQGQVKQIKNDYTRRFRTLQRATIADNSGSIDIIWFNQPFLVNTIHSNDTLSVSGRVETFNKKTLLQSPEYEVVNGETIHTGRLVPIYHETRGVTSKWLRRQIYKLLSEDKNQIVEFLPHTIRQKNSFMDLTEALETIHFPKNYEEVVRAKDRLAFDELFLLQLKSSQRREEWNKNNIGHAFTIKSKKNAIDKLIQSLPFTLTKAQEKAVSDIFDDLSKDRPMNRLLQGDVGSGKTVVAAIGMYAAFLNGSQSALMAPTEILAEQHFTSISKLLSPFGVTIGLVTGSKKSIKKKDEKNNFNILIGTHALLSENVKFDNLGFVVIDEQQRFGVEQRSIIRKKGVNPHLLTMTATPIPRTVALTMYGDLDLSYLNEMPVGRKIIKTWLVPPLKREGANAWIKKQVKETNSQIFIICPFIEESETMTTIKAANVEYERLRKEVFPDLKLGLIHGKLKAKEKDQVLDKFRANQLDILVATPVVEVGIDIPNATVILIEASERFGLAQLHQLRGRVGRGDKQSFCLLFTETKNTLTITRLKAMEMKHVGSELAELDLKLRGAGDIYGTAQHGLPRLKVASFSDFPLIQKARAAAQHVFPTLSTYPLLLEKMKTLHLQNVSPD